MAIPPLHARDVYIASPNCDPRRLPADSLEWQRLFPVAPPLANFLSELSHAPRPYKHFCPSKAHRPSYLLMLAWLLRHGWVTQLCTFAYIVVWPEIIYEVEYEMEAEELAAEAAAADAAAESNTNPPNPDDDAAADNISPDNVSPTTTTPSTPAPSHPPTLGSSTNLHSLLAASVSSASVTSSHDDTARTATPPPGAPPALSRVTSSTEVASAAERARLERIASRAHRQATERAMAHARKTPPLATPHPSLNDAAHLLPLKPHIILDAKKTTGREARYLSAIARRFRDDRVQNAWRSFCRYFDGRVALERIALLEDMKRKEAWGLLAHMKEHVICVRHW